MCDHGTSSGCFFTSKKAREPPQDITTSSRRQNNSHATTNHAVLHPKEPPSMVIQGDFRKVSGISNEIFRQIEIIENEYDASTAAALEAVERRGEMVVRILDTKHLGKAAAEAAKKFLNLQDSKHTVLLVEIIKRPGQTLGLYIREGNGLDRADGVFISRIALESAVYNSGCIKVGDEILAVNLVDVTRMSIDDVVIIMSIPRRLVLATRQVKGYPAGSNRGMGTYATLLHSRPPEPKPPPVVVLKNVTREQDMDDDDEDKPVHVRNDVPLAHIEKYRSQYDVDANDDPGTDLYYNSRPGPRHHQSSTLDRRIGGWSYTPQSSILDHHRLNNIQYNFDRNHPKTLESLAEKVHQFNPSGSNATLGRRTSDTGLSRYSLANKRYGITRCGSDQHLARTEYEEFNKTIPRQSHTLLQPNFRSSNGTGTMIPKYFRQYSAPSSTSSANYSSSSLKGNNVVDYASDTEASYLSIPKSSSYYYCKTNPTQTISGISSSTLSRLTKSGALTRASSLRSNSLPRITKMTRNHLPITGGLSNALSTTLKYGRDSNMHNVVVDREDYGALSAPDFPFTEKLRRGNFRLSTSNIYSSNEYRAWLSRTPSTSAMYDTMRNNREETSSLLKKKDWFTLSAENLPERTRQSEFLNYSEFRPGHMSSMGLVNTTPLPSATIATLDRHTRTSSLRRLRHMQDLEAKHLGNRSITPDVQIDRSRVLEINTSEFNKYKMEKSHMNGEYAAVSGLLWIHLLAGRGLRVNATALPLSGCNTGPSATKDLYCVLECDRIHKARTVVRNGDLVFDWDETFELDLFNNRELDFLVYSWDPQYRHKLCYKGSIHLSSLLHKSLIHQLALKVEPRGTLYLRLRHTSAYHTFLRKPDRPLLPSRSLLSANTLFGADLDMVVNKEAESVSISMQHLPQSPLLICVPIIVRRCVEEIERRGLGIIGLYRLCGSATKKRILREAFERNPLTIDLSPDNVLDLNVITGVFKDYLRELPEPLFTNHLYQMIVDALSVCMSDDPQGNAKLIFSLLDCLSRANKATLIFVMDHLSMVALQSATNKMTHQNLAIIFAPLMMVKSETEDKEIDFSQPINILRYLLEVWPSKSVREMISGTEKTSVVRTVLPPPLPKKPSVVSASVMGPLPIPSKGIRKPPPAVPDRYTQAALVFPIPERRSSTGSSLERAGNEPGKKLPTKLNVAPEADIFDRRNSQGRPPELPFRSIKRSSSIDEMSAGNHVTKVNGDVHSPKTNVGYSIQVIGGDNSSSLKSNQAESIKVEEALREVSNSFRSIPAASFGHSRDEVGVSVSSKQVIVNSLANSETGPWDAIVESWIMETQNEGVNDDIVAAALTDSFRRSHKNPFLSDLRNGPEDSTETNQFDETPDVIRNKALAFCVDSASFAPLGENTSINTAKEVDKISADDLSSSEEGRLS